MNNTQKSSESVCKNPWNYQALGLHTTPDIQITVQREEDFIIKNLDNRKHLNQ